MKHLSFECWKEKQFSHTRHNENTAAATRGPCRQEMGLILRWLQSLMEISSSAQWRKNHKWWAECLLLYKLLFKSQKVHSFFKSLLKKKSAIQMYFFTIWAIGTKINYFLLYNQCNQVSIYRSLWKYYLVI